MNIRVSICHSLRFLQFIDVTTMVINHGKYVKERLICKHILLYKEYSLLIYNARFGDMSNLICKPGTCIHGHNIWIVRNQGMSLKYGKLIQFYEFKWIYTQEEERKHHCHAPGKRVFRVQSNFELVIIFCALLY